MTARFDLSLLKVAGWLERFDSARAGAPREARQASAELAPGAMAAGRYRLQSVLGQGGMGRVWLAEDTLEKRTVALKEVRIAGAEGGAEADEGVDVAFKREFFTMTKLQHPSTVKVFDYGVLQTGDRYLCMEVVKGRDVRELIRQGPLDLKTLYRVLFELASVLSFIHSRLFVHCDIKSENIRLTETGALKLMDFGLMHQMGTPAGATLKGTPHYMAPEVPRGGIIDARTDLYSVGVLAFELATGRYPFDAKDLLTLLSEHMERPAPKLQPLRKVPQAFEDLVLKLLAKRPQDRFQSAAELTEALSPLAGRRAQAQDYRASSSYLHAAELVGRGQEQEQLRAALARTLDDHGQAVFLTAPAGVGKSRLLQEFQLSAKLADVPFFVGGCRAEGQAPLSALVEALQPLIPLTPPELLAQVGPVLARILPVLTARGVQPAPPAGPAADKLALNEALGSWLRGLAQHRPFIICLEDLHWADASSLELMNVGIRALAGCRAMVLGTARSNEIDPLSILFQTVEEELAQRIELPPLRQEDTQSLLSTMLRGAELPASLADQLHALSNGNAFFITESLRALIDRRSLQLEHGRWRLTVPPEVLKLPSSVEEVVDVRLRALPAPTLSLCQRLAPLGRALDLKLVQAVSEAPDEQLFERLDELVERQMLQRVDADYYFTHEVVRTGVYRGTPVPERAEHHRRAATALEQLQPKRRDENSALLAFHYHQAGLKEPAIRYYQVASDRAFASNVMLEGTLMLTKAADLLEEAGATAENPKLVSTWAKLVETAFSAHPPSCVRFAQKLVPLLETRVGPEGAARFYADLERLDRRGRWGARSLKKIWSEQPFDAKARDVRHLVPRLAIYRSLQAFSCGVMGQMPVALGLLEKQLAEHPRPGPFRAMGVISRSVGLHHMGLWQVQQREAGEAREAFEEHLRRVGVMPRWCYWYYVSTLYWTLVAQAAMGRPLAPEALARAQEVTAQHGFGDWKFMLATAQLYRASVVGDPVAMGKLYGELSDTLRRMGNPRLQEGRLALLPPQYHLLRGENDLAEAALARLEKFVQRSKDAWLRRTYLAYRARLALLSGPKGNAEGHIDEALAAAREVEHYNRLAQILCTQGKALQQRNDLDGARAAAQQALARAESPVTGCPLDLVLATRQLAELSAGDEAVQLAQRSLQVAQDNGLMVDEALSRVALAEALLPTQRGAAAALLGEAEEQLRTLKCKRHLDRIHTVRMASAG